MQKRSKNVVYIAISKDGFLADEKGSVDWLPSLASIESGEQNYREFYNSIDTLVMGRKTYEQVLGFGEWPYPGKDSYIISRSPKESKNPNIHFISSSIPSFLSFITSKDIKSLWIVGGGELIEGFHKEGAIDEFIVTVFPTILGKGIPFKTLHASNLHRVKTLDLGAGVVQDYYILK